MIEVIDERKTQEIEKLINDKFTKSNKSNDDIIPLRRSTRIAKKPPTNNFMSTDLSKYACGNGLDCDSDYIQCTRNDDHFEHLDCIERRGFDKNDILQNKDDFICCYCKKQDFIHGFGRESDPNYDLWSE